MTLNTSNLRNVIQFIRVVLSSQYYDSYIKYDWFIKMYEYYGQF